MSKDINIRYGESLKLTTNITEDLEGLTSLTFYVGAGGSELPLLTSIATIDTETAVIYEESIELPIGEYYYQYTAVFDDGSIEKYPEVKSCSSTLPAFIVSDALDTVEVE